MEGLIPMVFKAIKEKKKRSQYRCLSVGAADTGNIADDFYAFRNTPPTEPRGGGGFDERRAAGHRRYGSTGGYGINGGYDFKYGYDDDDHEVSDGNYKHHQHHHQQQLKRFGSHRMFSCITGAT